MMEGLAGSRIRLIAARLVRIFLANADTEIFFYF